MGDEILKKLEKIDKNTTATLLAVIAERDAAANVTDGLQEKEEQRKEQLKKAQKSFKTIGFKAHAQVFDAYEIYAKKEMGASSLSAFMREYSILLLENRDFQALFKEFQILQKNDDEHHQVSFFAPNSQFKELEKMAENEGFTIGQLTHNVMLELTKNKELRQKIITVIRA